MAGDELAYLERDAGVGEQGVAGAVECQAVNRTALALSFNSATRNAAINEDLRELGGEPVGACDLGIGQGRG